jgi:hypothetical protein
MVGEKNILSLQCPICLTEMQLMQKYEVDIDYLLQDRWKGEIDKIVANIQSRHMMNMHITRNIIIGEEGMMMTMTRTMMITIITDEEEREGY